MIILSNTYIKIKYKACAGKRKLSLTIKFC